MWRVLVLAAMAAAFGVTSLATDQPEGSSAAGGLTAARAPAPGHDVVRIEREDGVTRLHLGELERRSVTGRDLLDRVARLPSTVLIIRAYPLLVRTTKLYGRGRFWIEKGELFGYLQYQTESLGNDRPLCIIVHELAHAIEVAGVDRRNGTASIRDFVLSRAIGDDPLDWRGSETEFPRMLTHQVWLELLGRYRGSSVLDSLALAYRVSVPPSALAQAPADTPRPNQPPRSD
jgi:hypothetical protein